MHKKMRSHKMEILPFRGNQKAVCPTVLCAFHPYRNLYKSRGFDLDFLFDRC